MVRLKSRLIPLTTVGETEQFFLLHFYIVLEKNTTIYVTTKCVCIYYLIPVYRISYEKFCSQVNICKQFITAIQAEFMKA